MFGYAFVLAVWLFWLVVYWRGGLDILQDIRTATSQRDRVYLLVLTAATLSIVIHMIWMMWHTPQSHPLLGLGAALVLLGMVGTFYCRRHLGKFWTAENAVQANHQIIDTGPYAYVRHPIYISAIVLYLGTALAFPAWWNVVLVLVVVTVYALKTAHEDAFLSYTLHGYTDYQQRVRYRLLPGVW